MTYLEITEEIQKCDEKITYMNAHYRELREELRRLDEETMRQYKKKWLLEAKLITIKKCPAYKAPRKESKPPKAEMPSMKALSDEEALKLLNFLTDLKEEGGNKE